MARRGKTRILEKWSWKQKVSQGYGVFIFQPCFRCETTFWSFSDRNYSLKALFKEDQVHKVLQNGLEREHRGELEWQGPGEVVEGGREYSCLCDIIWYFPYFCNDIRFKIFEKRRNSTFNCSTQTQYFSF